MIRKLLYIIYIYIKWLFYMLYNYWFFKNKSIKKKDKYKDL